MNSMKREINMYSRECSLLTYKTQLVEKSLQNLDYYPIGKLREVVLQERCVQRYRFQSNPMGQCSELGQAHKTLAHKDLEHFGLTQLTNGQTSPAFLCFFELFCTFFVKIRIVQAGLLAHCFGMSFYILAYYVGLQHNRLDGTYFQ